MTCRAARAALTCAALMIPVFGASAQRDSAQNDNVPRDSAYEGSLIGIAVGLASYAGVTVPAATTLGVSWTQFHPGRLGLDLAVGTSPRIVADGIFVAGLRGGVALPLALAPNIFLIPSVGVSTILAENAAVYGVNGGLFAVFLEPHSVSLRAGLTLHRFQNDQSNALLFEAGVAFTP